jgi:hypothetical protein
MSDLKNIVSSLDEALRKFPPGFYNVEAINFYESALQKIERFQEVPLEALTICNEIRDNVEVLYSKRKYKEYGGLGRVKMRIAHSIRRLNQLTASISD